MNDNSKRFIGIPLLLLSIITSFILLEVSSRVIWKSKYNQWLEKQLHGFDYVDYKRSLIIPKANTVVTVEDQGGGLESHGKTIGLRNLQEIVQRDHLTGLSILFRINGHGLRGPEILTPKPSETFRILAIGDSCTWGPESDYYSYPRVMERELNSLVGEQFKFEVANAGVMGYNFERVLKRIDEFLEVEPDLVTIYLGWNQTIARADPRKTALLYRNLALYKIYYHFLVNRTSTGLQDDYNTKTTYEKNTPFLKKLEEYDFSYDLRDLDLLVKKIRTKRETTDIVIITLAGLFDIRYEPDLHALGIGHPIESTNNLYAYVPLTRRYNEELRRYAYGQKLNVIDFEAFAHGNFIPRSAYFQDSVHPNVEGYLKMGKYFANEIKRIKNLETKLQMLGNRSS